MQGYSANKITFTKDHDMNNQKEQEEISAKRILLNRLGCKDEKQFFSATGINLTYQSIIIQAMEEYATLKADKGSGVDDEAMKKKQEILDAYYAGFNQAHYSHQHPDLFQPKEMISAAKEWFTKTYNEPIFIHHSGNIIENEGDELFKQTTFPATNNQRLWKNPKAKIICLIGSTRFINEMSIIAWEFEKKGYIVMSPRLLPSNYVRDEKDDGRHAAESEGVKEIIDNTYLEKVAMSDEIYVCNLENYLGDSSKNELRHAVSLGKKIRWHEPESANKYLTEIKSLRS